MFITFEGPDGSGKTTVLQKLLPILQSKTKSKIFLSREPGGNNISEAIRKIILNDSNNKMDVRTEILLYAASRSQHVVENILPHLNNNDIVISDRFIDSSVVYQGIARNFDENIVLKINSFATNGLLPDLTLYLDIPPLLGLQRIKKTRNKLDRLEKENILFHENVRKGYLKLLKDNPERIMKINATKPLNLVVNDCLNIIIKKFPTYFK